MVELYSNVSRIGSARPRFVSSAHMRKLRPNSCLHLHRDSPRLWQTADLLALCRHPSACVSQPAAAAAAAATVAADIATA
uniref:Uncharacterized protein n=1 Tax=Vespula pensylvanica TaxID=30213 RepID=A0A834PEI2_VESPE|nr:hypothetical protein H0235_000639 [Vespula pensylvanica]